MKSNSSSFYLDYAALSEKDAVDLFVSEYVSGNLNQTSGLSNGDEVSYSWNCLDDAAKNNLKVNLKHSKKTFKVSDLTEAETFDPFEDLLVEFSGISPYGIATVKNNSKLAAAESLGFTISQDEELKNGDKVTVSISDQYGDAAENCLSEYGMLPSPMEKEYTVSGLDSYVTSSDQISEKSLEEMKAQAEDVLKSVQASRSDSTEWKSITYLGNYLLTIKDARRDNVWGNIENQIYLVYRVTVRNWEITEYNSFDEEMTFYWYISYSNLSYQESGETIVDIGDYSTPYESVYNGNSFLVRWYYDGFENLDGLYKSVVQSNAEDYNCEDNIDESVEDAKVESSAAETAATTSQGASSSTESGIIFSDSSSRMLTDAEVKNLSQEDLRSAVNEIYARAGYTFSNQELLNYYKQYSWYNPTISAADFKDSDLSKTEKANVDLLQKYRTDQ